MTKDASNSRTDNGPVWVGGKRTGWGSDPSRSLLGQMGAGRATRYRASVRGNRVTSYRVFHVKREGETED